MYFIQKEHNPPHFHAFYGNYVGAIDISCNELWINGKEAQKISEPITQINEENNNYN